MGNSHSEIKKCHSLPNSPHNRRLSSTLKTNINGGSAIPTPALGARKPHSDQHANRSSPRSGSAASNAVSGSPFKGVASTTSSRSTSPASNSSFIPTPRSNGIRTPVPEKYKQSGSSIRSAFRTSNSSVVPSGGTTSVSQSPQLSKQKDSSVLDKFKFFNSNPHSKNTQNSGKEKENKQLKSSGSSSGVSKRTSSSSGFSSARSERSDSSSTSLCSDARLPAPPLPPHLNLPGSTTSSSSGEQAVLPEQQQQQLPPTKSPGLRGIRSRFSRGNKESKERDSSPKFNRRSEERESIKGSPRSNHRSNKGNDSKEKNKERENKKVDRLTLNLNTSKPSDSVNQVVRGNKIASNSQRPLSNYNQKTSPTITSQPPLLSSPLGSTGIPKPFAAVKGTTKPTPEKSSPSSSNVNSFTHNKEYQNKMTKSSPAPPVRRNPIGDEAPSTTEMKDPKGSLPRQRNLIRREETGHSPSVAMVSPMPVTKIIHGHNNSAESTYNVIEESQISYPSCSPMTKKQNSEDISFEKKIIKEPRGRIVKIEDAEDVVIDIQPMQPLKRPAQYGYIRGLGKPNGNMISPSMHVTRMGFHENSHTVPQKGMRMTPTHLQRHLVPNSYRSARSVNGQVVGSEYGDIECVDIANGYMSDGEVLRSNIGCSTYPPQNLDGYMSEGGASLCAHRINQRFKEGMRQVNDSMNKVQHFLHDDSFDDSSSLSSGISDTLNDLSEDFLSTSLSSDQNPSVVKIGSGKDASSLKLPVGLSSFSARKGSMGVNPSGAYKVVSSKAHVKKTEPSQSPDPRVPASFKHLSSSQWKKYMDNGKNNFDAKDQRSLIETNGASTPRKTEQRKCIASPSVVHQDNAQVYKHQLGFSPTSNGGRKQDRRIAVMNEKKDKVTSSVQINGDSKKFQNPKTTPSGLGFRRNDGYSANNGMHKVISSKVKEPSASSVAVSSSNSQGNSSHSLDRPRTKLKVSGGTQTTSDLQYMPGSAGFHSDGEYSSNSLGRKYQQMKSYSLSGSAAAHLSQGVRDRILQSPYRKIHLSGGDFNTSGSSFYRERSPRMKMTDGSLSDNSYSSYAEIQYGGNPFGSPYSWASRNSYMSAMPSNYTRRTGSYATEGDGVDGIGSPASNIVSQMQQARNNSLTQARFMMHQRDISTSPSPRLSRSNSVRSTKSDKIFNAREGYHNSQPTSPTPPSARLPMSPMNAARGSALYSSTVSRTSKDDECHGSSLSLVSSSSSLYSCQEEKHAHEVRKLRKDLSEAQDKVATLTNQLTTNAHVVAAFEQSLTNMTTRLQKLTASSEQKECELTELRKTIDALRQQSIDAGLTFANIQTDNLIRGVSTESLSSLSSACSATSHASNQDKSESAKLGKKKGWLRSSFSKAFSRGKGKKHSGSSFSDAEEGKSELEMGSNPSSPLPVRGIAEGGEQDTVITENKDQFSSDEVENLKRQLWEKDMVLTDIRLEALTSAHQLESLKETLTKMRSEMRNLKDDNDRLQQLMASKSLNSSRNSLQASEALTTANIDYRASVSEDIIAIDDPTDVLLVDPLDKESKRVTISVLLGYCGDYEKCVDIAEFPAQECAIGAISISNKTKWDILDSLIKRVFKEYLSRVDPSSNLGINSDSILSYNLGEMKRDRNSETPELLPCGYLVGEVTNIQIILKDSSTNSLDAMAFETLIPKSILQRYISLLTEHRRIILCGSSGTGKTYLAQNLAQFLVCRLGKDPSPGNIATFSVDHKNEKDLSAYLSHISDQCETNASELPLVIILDNLHFAGLLTDVFTGFLSAKYSQCPFIIGTMIQATSCSTTNLQLHHNFRWVLMANHLEPTKGLLSKIARRKLTQVEVETNSRQPRLQQILDWMPKCWAHLNKFLESHSSSDVTIGPRLFLSCPASVDGSQIWFTDLWNYSLLPYIVEAVREGLQLYGRRSSWEDPCQWIHETYPWITPGGVNALLPIRSEDVGYDILPTQGDKKERKTSECEEGKDPLLSMLLRLQEAANFSSPQQDTAPTMLQNMDNALESTL